MSTSPSSSIRSRQQQQQQQYSAGTAAGGAASFAPPGQSKTSTTTTTTTTATNPTPTTNRGPIKRAARPGKSAASVGGGGGGGSAATGVDVLRERTARMNLSSSSSSPSAEGGGGDVVFFPSSSSNSAVEANRMKESGNRAFRAGRYQVAAANYNGALELMSRDCSVVPAPDPILASSSYLSSPSSSVRVTVAAQLPSPGRVIMGGRDAAVCYANRAAARLMMVGSTVAGRERNTRHVYRLHMYSQGVSYRIVSSFHFISSSALTHSSFVLTRLFLSYLSHHQERLNIC